MGNIGVVWGEKKKRNLGEFPSNLCQGLALARLGISLDALVATVEGSPICFCMCTVHTAWPYKNLMLLWLLWREVRGINNIIVTEVGVAIYIEGQVKCRGHI